MEIIRHLASDENICPTCGEPAITWCRCHEQHSSCKNSHKWRLSNKVKREFIDGRWHVVEVWQFRIPE